MSEFRHDTKYAADQEIRETVKHALETIKALSGIRGAERQEGWPRREDAWVVEAGW
jgi:hypothetical protein